MTNVTCLTLCDPGYFRHPGGGALNPPPPPPPPIRSRKLLYQSSPSYMCILLGVLGMFQLEFVKNSRFQPFYSDFKI